MQCLKGNHFTGKPWVCPQKGSKISTASIFFLAFFIVFSITTVAIAQSRQGAPQPPLSLEEERIMKNCSYNALSATGQKPVDYRVIVNELQKDLEHYMRDGCKKALAGDWRWADWGDIVRIQYKEEQKVFVGDVKKGVEMPQGHLLFKVYFPKTQEGKYRLTCTINSLRALKACSGWSFTGTEYSFKPNTKERTAFDLQLILDGDRIEYKVEKEAYFLTRVK